MECPMCKSEERDSNSPRTTYSCGSSDYDQRPDSFQQSVECTRRRRAQSSMPIDQEALLAAIDANAELTKRIDALESAIREATWFACGSLMWALDGTANTDRLIRSVKELAGRVDVHNRATREPCQTLARALAHYGLAHQLDQTIEECAELTVAIRHERRGRGSFDAIVEEIADLSIMLEQFHGSFGAQIDRVKAEKLARLEKRLDEEGVAK